MCSWEHLVGAARAHVMSFELLIVVGHVSDFPIVCGNARLDSDGLVSIMRVSSDSALIDLRVHIAIVVVIHLGIQADRIIATPRTRVLGNISPHLHTRCLEKSSREET